MIKELIFILLIGSIFGQDRLILTNGTEYQGKIDRVESENIYFFPKGEYGAQSVKIEMIRLLEQGSVTLVEDGQMIKNSSVVAHSDKNIRDIASQTIHASVHHGNPGFLDSPSMIVLSGIPISLVLGEVLAPPQLKPELFMLPILSGFITLGIKRHRNFSNFDMVTEREAFLESTSESNIGFDERSIIFAEQLGELAAHNSISRHQFHMNPFRRVVTNYAVTMPLIPILFALAPATVLTYPFVFPQIYDRYNQKTYFDKKMENYLTTLPEHEHDIFTSKYDPIVQDYKKRNPGHIKIQTMNYNTLQIITIGAVGFMVIINALQNISLT